MSDWILAKAWQRQFRVDAELTWSLALRDIRVRYRRSIGGFLWSMGKPVLLTMILWAVFSHILRIPFKHEAVPYWLFMLTSIIGWNFTVGALMEGTHSICSNGSLIRKVPLNSAVFPVSVLLSNSFHYAMALLVLFAVLIVGGWFSFSVGIFVLPIIILVQALFVLGLVFLTSSLQVFYRDVGNALELIIMAWFYVTPILYPCDLAREQLVEKFGTWAWAVYMGLNPPAVFAAATRRCLLLSANAELPDRELMLAFTGAVVITVVLFAVTWRIFSKRSERFADEL